ncbi:MAG: ATP-dependent carboligase, partial [Methanoregula sp.]|nr:ATP-dependent carboligase [Methanoregula sp.]
MKGRVLVAGFSTRHVAQSAARAGYEVCAVDHFCDQDLAWYTREHEKFDELDELPDAISRLAQRYAFDGIVL